MRAGLPIQCTAPTPDATTLPNSTGRPPAGQTKSPGLSRASQISWLSAGVTTTPSRAPAFRVVRHSMTPARAAMVVAGVELGRRTLTRPRPDRTRLGTPREVAAFLLPHYGASPVERFGIISLCTKYRMLRTEIVSTGTLDASLVHPREVFRTAAMHRAAAIVLFHNHPSGDPSPSVDDVALTERLQQAGILMGIEVLDHVILADTRYCSFKEMGRL